jgi:hypothetical protein
MIFRRNRITPAPRRLVCESLEARLVLSGAPLITELMAANENTLTDAAGIASDWIEIYNPTDAVVDLAGWHLTDSAGNLDKWTFPEDPVSVLDPGEYLVVFASGQVAGDEIDAGGNLHTNFRLSSSGDYLALTRGDESVASEYAPAYPPQLTDVSYGLPMDQQRAVLLSEGAPVEVFVPSDDSLGERWTAPDFSPDEPWITESAPGVPALTGVGFDTSTPVPHLVSHWPLNELPGTSGTGSADDVMARGNDGTPVGDVAFGVDGASDFTDLAASFADGSIDVSYDASLNPASFTLSVWAKADADDGQAYSVVTNRDDSSPGLHGFALYNIDGHWSFWTGSGASASQWDRLDGPPVDIGIWTHLAISFDAARSRKTLRVNGTLAATTALQGYAPNPSRDFHIGGGGNLGGQFRFDGQSTGSSK